MDAIKEAHYNLGIAYLEAGQYNRAVPEFEAAIKLDANFIGAHCALCRAYLEQDELEKANTAVTEALKLDATHQPAMLLCDTITQAYYNRGRQHLDAGRYTEAVPTFQKALTLDADLGRNPEVSDTENKHIHAHLGAAYIGLKAYQEAIKALQNAIALDADLVDAHYNLGYAYVEQGHPDKAVPHFERAIAIAPNFKRAHYNLARAHRESGNLEAATYAVTETLRLDPNYQPAHDLANAIKQAHYNKGITYFNGERYSEAATAFQNAITLDADFMTAHYNLGLTYLKMETYPRAVEALQKTIALDSTYTAAHHALALAYLGQQELGKAREAAREALKLDANYQPAHALLEAIDPSFTPLETQTTTPPKPEQPIDRQPAAKSSQETHYELGIAYRDANMLTEAIAEFQKAIDLDPDFVTAHVSLGEAYLETEQLGDAENAANAALKVDTNSQSAYQLLENIKQARPTPPQPTPTKSVSTPPSDTSDVKQDLERGLVFLSNKQYNQAAAAFKRVIKVDPSLVEAHYSLAQAYLEIGAFDDAKAATDEALRRNPNHRQAREFLQIIKFARNLEKNKKIWKKIRGYAVILSIIAVAAVIIFKIWFDNPQPNIENQKSTNTVKQQSGLKNQKSNINNQQPSPRDLIEIAASLEEPSGNGSLDASETGRLRIIVRNSGSTVRNVRVRIDPPFIAGVPYKQPARISKLGKNNPETIAVSMSADKNVRERDQSLDIQLFSNDGQLLYSKKFTLKT